MSPTAARRALRRAAAAAAVLLLAGCGADTPAPRSAPSPASPAPSGPVFTNPVWAENFPDPGVLAAGGGYHAFGTNGGGANVPVLVSDDLVRWTPAGDALPTLGRWASGGNTWAPEAIAGGGGYLLYYTARATAPDKQCIGVARARQPGGPYTDDAAAPLVCQTAEGGSIDASPYRDEAGRLWLTWKNDGNAVQRPTHLYAARLSADGRSLAGRPARLLTNDAAWEGAVVEAPQFVRHGGKLYLFYSGNAFNEDTYAVGYAVCDGPAGPCRKAAENPVLKTSAAAAGPGHSYLVTLPGDATWLLYHAWPPDAIGSAVPGRQLWLDRVDWEGDKPVVRGPTTGAQPAPAG